MDPMITVTANGESLECRKDMLIPDYLNSHNLDLQSVVIEWNGKALTRTEAAEVKLSDGDCLEIVRIVAGG